MDNQGSVVRVQGSGDDGLRSIRASSMPLAALCAASQLKDEFAVDTGGEAADLGSADHWVITRRIAGKHADVLEAAAKFQVDEHELGKLVAWTWNSWNRDKDAAGHTMSDYFPWPECEKEFKVEDVRAGLELTGHVDVISLIESEALIRIADFKTGRLDTDYVEQLRAYAFLAIKTYPWANSVYAVAIQVRRRSVDGYFWSREQLEEWWEERSKQILAGSYHSAAKHCQFCRRVTTCPKIVGEIQQARRVLMEHLIDGTPEEIASQLATDPAVLGPVIGVMKDADSLYQKRRDNWFEAARIVLKQIGGVAPIGDGREAFLNQQEQHPLKATTDSIKLVQSLVLSDQIPDVLGIDKGALEKAVKGSVGRGQKKTVWAETLEKFEAMGCVETKVIERLEMRHVTTELPAIGADDVPATTAEPAA